MFLVLFVIDEEFSYLHICNLSIFSLYAIRSDGDAIRSDDLTKTKPIFKVVTKAVALCAGF